MDLLRRELKTWEKDFKKKHGRKPNKNDIKSDKAIASLYKSYNDMKREPKNDIFNETPTKLIGQVVGPTPDLKGRVLSIFDIKSPPNCNDSNLDSDIASSTPCGANITTPVKSRHISNMDETPLYLKFPIGSSPSPLKPRSTGSLKALLERAQSVREMPSLSPDRSDVTQPNSFDLSANSGSPFAFSQPLFSLGSIANASDLPHSPPAPTTTQKETSPTKPTFQKKIKRNRPVHRLKIVPEKMSKPSANYRRLNIRGKFGKR
ncbi:hypothetical protein CANCADRAFT_4049 [Tortispora caseinolytica NRRL Y-17796]|uniref:DNA replication regulator SLD2 n=1 Tax=Tortispora caseinolytica NRRL Y-17796 TaxID=767744 RepID=A0A1E4TCQ9_9ASCO|nr:hypothetical protein CANCADRAFT_4049 [Tortispora caseinolytica NRRL Y-17796]